MAVASAGPYANNLHLAPNMITAPTPHHSIFTGWMLFLSPKQQCQITVGMYLLTAIKQKYMAPF